MAYSLSRQLPWQRHYRGRRVGMSATFSTGSQTVSQRNIFGGQDFYSGGQMVGRTTPNVFGGQTFYNGSGQMTGQSTPNLLGGSNYYGR